MSNQQNQSSNNEHHDEPRSGDLLREYRNNMQRPSPPSALPGQPKESVITNTPSSGSSPRMPVPAPEIRPYAAQVLASEEQALKINPKQEPPFSNSANGSSQDGKAPSAPFAMKEPASIPDAKKADILPQGIRERSGPPSTPGVSARRTRLAPIEESPTIPISHSQDSQSLIATTVEMVRRLTGKMTAINKAAYEPPPPAREVYRPIELIEPQIRTRNWRRSRTVRTSMRMRQRRIRAQRSAPNGQVILLSFLMVLFALLVISVSSGGAYAYSFYQSKLPQVDNIANQQIDQVSRFYDRNGVFLGDDYDPNAGRRTYVDISTIPQVMQDAMVAAENRSFWTDPGIDPQGITRAAIDYASHGFKVEQGASTLTQQLVKDLTDNNQVTFDRKLNEGAVAIGLTQRFPKEKILEMYLNVAPFGNLRLGVESASQDYFSLTRQCTQNFAQGTFTCVPAVSQLDYDPVKKTHDPVLALARATFLASLPQDPSDYDPNVWSTRPAYRQIVLARQLSVVSAMMDMGTPVQGLGPHGQPGLITPAIRQQVATLTSKMTFKAYKRNWQDPDFMYWSISQVERALGNGDSAKGAVILQTGGFNIRTTIDSNLEGYVERVIKHQLDDLTYQKFLPTPYAILSRDYNVGNAAAVVMNSKTGEILALAGSKDYNNTTDPRVDGQYDVATANDGHNLGRQPGSSFKPIVYATALEMGWYPSLVLPDQQTIFPNGQPTGTANDYHVNTDGVWIPVDYGTTIAGNHVLPMRYDLANSFNIPAGKAMAFAGADNVYNTAVRMGITAIADQGASCFQKKADLSQCLGTSTALGTTGVPLIQLTGAYQTFSDNGAHVPQQVVLDIWNNHGNHLYHFDPAHVQKAQVISPQVAYMITSMMADEGARALEFTGDHDLSFWDWEPSCSIQSYRPYPDCQQEQVAAKTGTTEDFRDNLTLGYTPSVVVGVWAGNSNNAQLTKGVVGITGAAPIWNAIISRLSGKHCSDTDGVTCGFLDLKGLGLSDQGVFTNPGGLVVKCVSATDGLMGDGGNDCDLTLPNQAPLQSGIFSALPKNNDGGNNNGGNNNGGHHHGGNNGGNNNGGGGGKRPG